MSTNETVTSATSRIWDNHVSVPDTPAGFTVRTTTPANPDGVEVMLERWEAGSAEPPHSHPGDDMTVVIEGRMSVQFYNREGADLVPDGDPLVLGREDAGLVGHEGLIPVTHLQITLGHQPFVDPQDGVLIDSQLPSQLPHRR